MLYAANPARLPMAVKRALRQADPPQGGFQQRGRVWPWGCRLAACASVYLAWELWARADQPNAASVVVVVSSMVSASAVVALAPVWPRVSWLTAFASPPLVAALLCVRWVVG